MALNEKWQVLQEMVLSMFDRVCKPQLMTKVALLVSLGLLNACGALRSVTDFPGFTEPKLEDLETPPREFITALDVTKIQLGMSPLEVRNILGPPMLNEGNEQAQWDYVLRQGQGATEEYVPYAIFFKDNKVVKLSPLDLSPEKIAASSKPAPDPTPVVGEHVVMKAPPDVAQTSDLQVNDAAEINDMLSAWVNAWSSKDVQGYLSFYASTFEHGSKSRKAWENLRRQRILQPADIQITLSNVEINLQSDVLAQVRFTQKYSSKKFSDSGSKILILSKATGKWKIQSEEFQK